jgi:PAS domain S-box-containing protein
MLWIVSIFLFVATVWLVRYILESRRIIADLTDAVQARRRLLPECSDARIKHLGFKGLLDEANSLIEDHKVSTVQNSGNSEQFAVILQAVQEVVVIFDADRIVQFSNRAAEQLFHSGSSMKGLRVDSVIRSVDILDFLEQRGAESLKGDNQVRITVEGRELWFEISCTEVRRGDNQEGLSRLMVLHDITRLKMLEVMRRDFVANVSHELRTPLTIIKGYAETLVDDHEALPLVSRQRFLKKILTNAERLHVLVEDLLGLSRLESEADEYEPVVQPLKPLFESVAEDYQQRLSEGQAIAVEFDDTIPPIPFDRLRLNQVLDNFVENVFRYAPDFKQLTLSATYDTANGRVVCSVTDDGPGIPAEDLPFIFERFYRVDKGRAVEKGGTGLGLSIVKHIVKMHGGSVEADSKLGEWTRMTFTLPHARSMAPSVL